jgi:hypothetical protein
MIREPLLPAQLTQMLFQQSPGTRSDTSRIFVFPFPTIDVATSLVKDFGRNSLAPFRPFRM